MYETKSFKGINITVNISISKEGKIYRVVQRIYETLSIVHWTFDDPEKAMNFFETLVSDKLEKGFKEI